MSEAIVKRELGFAFLGCGHMAGRHSATLRKVAPETRHYFASRSSKRAEEFSGKHGGSGAFGDYRAALDSPAVDAVVLTLPPHEHLSWTVDALAAGKHVIVEKPAYLTLADFDRAIAAAREHGRQLIVAENYFYRPLLRRIRGLLTEGAIGEPLCLYVNALKNQRVDDWRGDPAISGGGALFEGGIHWLNFMANLGLEVRGVTAQFPGNPDVMTERSSVVTFEYESGVSGTLLYSWETPSLIPLRASRIYGREGSIFFETNGICAAVYGRKKRFFFPGFRDISGFRAMWTDFVSALREGRPPALDIERARRDYVHLESAYECGRRAAAAATQTTLKSVGERQCSG